MLDMVTRRRLLTALALAHWRTSQESRDSLVIGAYRAGVTKKKIHELSGLSRSTIDAILRNEGKEGK